jgi:hypothetical protein
MLRGQSAYQIRRVILYIYERAEICGITPNRYKNSYEREPDSKSREIDNEALE